MRALAVHLLHLAENRAAAGARAIFIWVEEDLPQDRLRLSLTDDGQAIAAGQSERATGPCVTGWTDRQTGLGLELPALQAAAQACQGGLSVQSAPGLGTTVTVDFQRSHRDRLPLGDLAGTCLSLLIAHPQVHWRFEYGAGPVRFVFDDQDLKRELRGLPLSDPAVRQFLRPLLEEGMARVRGAALEARLALPAGGH